MKRDLAALSSVTYDLLVIGGGVVGACIARDAARRGLTVALIEQNDFAAAASEAMSHTIHGGIRYLSSGQFGLVRQGLSERGIWMRIAPDFVSEQDWLLPLTAGRRGLQNRFGLALYQWMAGRKSHVIAKSEALLAEPALAMDGLHGAAVYQDFHIADPHSLIIAMLKDASAHGAQIANHTSAVELVQSSGKLAGIVALDCLSDDRFTIEARQIVNATGPWAQAVIDRFVPGQSSLRVTGSKGIHLVTPALSRTHAIAVSGKGEHAFVVPWQGFSLFGTTDDVFSGDLSSVAATEKDIETLKAKIARLMPMALPFLEQTLSAFAGVRALPGAGGNTYRVAREELIVNHASEGAPDLWTATGGKWTTARLMAERLVDLIEARSGVKLKSCDTRHAVIAARPQPAFLPDRLEAATMHEMAVTAQDHLRRLGRHTVLQASGLKVEVESWLARRQNSDNSDAGRDGRLS